MWGDIMTEGEFQQYSLYTFQNFGINLGREKKALLESRLYKLFNSEILPRECRNTAAFYQCLQQDKDGSMRELFSSVITTNHTYFMRESDHFRIFAEEVLPYWGDQIKNGDVRTWCAACSSGEEAYTLAMILQDFFSLRPGFWDISLLATDLSPRVLRQAKQGIYAREAVSSLPLHWQQAYFRHLGSEKMQVVPQLQRQIIFRRFNLMDNFPFRKPFHTIFCRNVMIYFDIETRQKLARKLYDYLEPGGFLFIGHSEVIDRTNIPFSYVMPSVYRKV